MTPSRATGSDQPLPSPLFSHCQRSIPFFFMLYRFCKPWSSIFFEESKRDWIFSIIISCRYWAELFEKKFINLDLRRLDYTLRVHWPLDLQYYGMQYSCDSTEANCIYNKVQVRFRVWLQFFRLKILK